jgi:membrane protease YdiL (CAAX protease family)
MPKVAKHEPVANYRHSVGFLGIVALVAMMGYAAQHRQVAGGGLTESHAHVIPIYLSATVLNWLLVLFAWRGIRRRGGTVASLVRGRWENGHEIFRDLGIAALFWGVVFAVAWGMGRLLGRGVEKSVDILLPRSLLEVGVWFLTAASAGFCEEFVFRGYAMRQLLALSNSTVAAVAGQGVVFGLMHAYQGWRPVIRITIIGILFGALAAWRKTLRVGMIAHGWQDFWAGWLGKVLLR